MSSQQKIPEVLPKAGLVFSEKTSFTEILCKPKIIPIKSHILKQIEEAEKAALGVNPTTPATSGTIGGN